LSGPLALPARWRTGAAETGGPELETSAEAMILAGAASGGPACVTAERSRYRLHSKQGVLLRGDGHARRSGPAARVAVDARRVTWWRGEDSHTIAAATAQRP